MADKVFGPAANMSFEELLSIEANNNKGDIVAAILQAVRDGEPSALKIVSTAILNSQYSEDKKFIISDDRFREIILVASDRIRASQQQAKQIT